MTGLVYKKVFCESPIQLSSIFSSDVTNFVLSILFAWNPSGSLPAMKVSCLQEYVSSKKTKPIPTKFNAGDQILKYMYKYRFGDLGCIDHMLKLHFSSVF